MENMVGLQRTWRNDLEHSHKHGQQLHGYATSLSLTEQWEILARVDVEELT
jgi:hypothetical protein